MDRHLSMQVEKREEKIKSSSRSSDIKLDYHRQPHNKIILTSHPYCKHSAHPVSIPPYILPEGYPPSTLSIFGNLILGSSDLWPTFTGLTLPTIVTLWKSHLVIQSTGLLYYTTMQHSCFCSHTHNQTEVVPADID